LEEGAAAGLPERVRPALADDRRRHRQRDRAIAGLLMRVLDGGQRRHLADLREARRGAAAAEDGGAEQGGQGGGAGQGRAHVPYSSRAARRAGTATVTVLADTTIASMTRFDFVLATRIAAPCAASSRALPCAVRRSAAVSSTIDTRSPLCTTIGV